jgi:hypothetical protein
LITQKVIIYELEPHFYHTSNQLLRVFGVLKGFNTETDNFMGDVTAIIKNFIISCHKEYLSGPKTMTLVEFVENQMLIEAE